MGPLIVADGVVRTIHIHLHPLLCLWSGSIPRSWTRRGTESVSQRDDHLLTTPFSTFDPFSPKPAAHGAPTTPKTRIDPQTGNY